MPAPPKPPLAPDQSCLRPPQPTRHRPNFPRSSLPPPHILTSSQAQILTSAAASLHSPPSHRLPRLISPTAAASNNHLRHRYLPGITSSLAQILTTSSLDAPTRVLSGRPHFPRSSSYEQKRTKWVRNMSSISPSPPPPPNIHLRHSHSPPPPPDTHFPRRHFSTLTSPSAPHTHLPPESDTRLLAGTCTSSAL